MKANNQALLCMFGFAFFVLVAPAGVHLQTLKSFEPEKSDDRWAPVAGVIEGTDGAFYGTTTGENFIDYVWGGTVFKINKDGTGYRVLHIFEVGNAPRAELLEGSDGAIYGTSCCFVEPCGNMDTNCFRGVGQILKLNKDGSIFSMLHRFTQKEDSGFNESGLVEGKDGALYGTTSPGNPNPEGIVYRLTKDGTAFSILHRFGDSGDGAAPVAVITASDGALYGTTAYGGDADAGTVFMLQTDGSHYRILHNFGFGGNGQNPQVRLIEGTDRALYGTTPGVWTNRTGTVFKLDKDGSGYQVVLRFATNNAVSGLVEGRDGALYGITDPGDGDGAGEMSGVFRVNKDGSGYLELYSSFPDFLYRGPPGLFRPRLVQGRDGAFYGTTAAGGTYTNNWGAGGGTVFKLWPPETPEISGLPLRLPHKKMRDNFPAIM
jgi:uncharacterized repeat protein (TIGR03803 family)